MTRRAAAVYLCLVPILAASMSHVAGAFGAYERADAWQWWGWLAAVGIDAAIALFVWRLIDGERRGGDRWALAGVILASIVSAQTNLAHALTVAVERGVGGWVLKAWAGSTTWAVLGVLCVSITLPVLVGILAAVAHGDAAAHAPVKATRKPRTPTGDMADAVAGFAELAVLREQRATQPQPARPATTADAARAMAAAEPELRRVDIARRLGVHPAQVSRALNGRTADD